MHGPFNSHICCYSGDGVGPGPERGTYLRALEVVLADKMLWTYHPELRELVPNFSSIFLSDERRAAYKTYGAFIALFILKMSQAPPRLSKWVVLSLMEPSFNPSMDLVRRYDPSIVSALDAWFARPSGPPKSVHLGESTPTPIDTLIFDVFGGKTVRMLEWTGVSSCLRLRRLFKCPTNPVPHLLIAL